MLTLSLLVLSVNIALISSQAIPYSYSEGRNVSAVEDRYNRFKAAKDRKAAPEELIAICGKVDLSKQHCNTKILHSKDSENLACDSLCCMSGQKIGNCGNDYGFELNFDKLKKTLTDALTGGPLAAAYGVIDSSVTANCFCSDDVHDIKCGKDGSVLGIRCPIDESACWRKCCREGKSGGTCGGTLKTSCNCSD